MEERIIMGMHKDKPIRKMNHREIEDELRMMKESGVLERVGKFLIEIGERKTSTIK
jgi:hypothetical protein